jgi:hypothetical protein
MRSTNLVWLLGAGLLLNSVVASADPITVDNAFYFRENRGANDVGQPAGNRLIFGAGSVVPNGDGGTTATRAFGGGGAFSLPFNPRTVNLNQFSGSTDYTSGRAALPVNLVFTNGADTTSVSVGAIGTIGLMPLAFDLSVSGLGLDLTFHWTVPVIPAGLTLERAQILVYDLETFNAAGNADTIYNPFLSSPTDTSFAMPDTFSGGLSLQWDHHYAFGIRLEDLREGVDQTLGGPARLSSSQAYYSFTTPIPEPEIYAMLGIGLGLLGWVGRRKKLKEGAAA